MSTRDRYFAYGSNLDSADLRRWCGEKGLPYPLGQAICRAYLPERELAFTYYSQTREGGALDLRERPGQLVPGVLFEVNEDGWRVLDRKEGLGTNYRRENIHVLDEDGRTLPAVTYVVRPTRRVPHAPPRPEYLDTVRTGMRRHEVEGEEQLSAAAEGRDAPWLVDAVFAYGTLMRGEHFFHRLAELADMECSLLATTRGRLFDLGSYPAMQLDPGGSTLHGEFFRVGNVDTVLQLLDQIEGFSGYACGSLYERVLMSVDAGDSRTRLAWTYLLGDGVEPGPEIESGCWRTHTGRRNPFVQELARAHCGEREAEIAAMLADRIPFNLGGRGREVAQSLLPLAEAILSGLVSERRLAQVSGRWVCLADSATDAEGL
jgi:gamma-glutamylcyclotransferase (GGCT)/AIG2-like uncharacterized protein YtfP